MDKQENIEQKESSGEEQPQTQEQKPDQEQPQAQEQRGDKETNLSEETPPTIVQVLDFLKKSNLVNLDLPMKSLLEQVQSVQPDLPTEWGFIGDSGHWVLIWKRKDS